MIGGPGFDRELIRQMEESSGIPAVTTSTALMEVFSLLGLKRLAIVTPYSDALNRLEVEFLADAGYETTGIKGLNIEDTSVLPFVQPEEFYKLALEQDISGADALFISCTGICAVDLIEPLEKIRNIPVLTSNQATIWYALRRIGYQHPLPGLGILGQKSYPAG